MLFSLLILVIATAQVPAIKPVNLGTGKPTPKVNPPAIKHVDLGSHKPSAAKSK